MNLKIVRIEYFQLNEKLNLYDIKVSAIQIN